MSQSDKLARYVQYLESKLNQPNYCINLLNNHRNWQSIPDYAFPYCKEIQELSDLSGRYNCGFRPLTQSKLADYALDLPPLPADSIYLIAILSNESTRTMTEHSQYLIYIQINIFNHCYVLHILVDQPRIFNQYDPIMSTSQEFAGHYGYQPIDYTDRLIQSILDDNLESLPEFQSKYYKDVYLKSSQGKKQLEIRKIFPFLTHTSIMEISMSESQSLIFYYCKILINSHLTQLLSDCFTEQSESNIEYLKTLFPKLTSSDFATIFNAEDPARQYESLCQVLLRPDKGLSYGEIIKYTVEYLKPYLCQIDFNEDNAIDQLLSAIGVN
jgi:hypothetical protein